MAEETQVSGQTGEEGLPTPQFSETGGSSPSADVDVIVNRVVERLAPTLDQVVEKKAKSLQDKRFSKIEKELGLRSNVLAELQEAGVDIPKDVLTEMRLRELEEQRTEKTTQPAEVRDNGLSQPKAAVTEAIARLQEYGLDQNDPGFIELLRGKYANRAEFDNKVLGHIVSKLKPPKPANPADVVQAPMRGNLTTTAQQIEQGYLEEIAKVPRGNIRMVSQVQAKWRKKAAEVGLRLNV